MAAERRARIPLYVGPGPTIALEVGGTPEEVLAARQAFESQVRDMEMSGDWVFEVKHDGFWCLAQVEGGAIAHMVSRTGLDFAPVDVMAHRGLRLTPKNVSGRLVGELVSREGQRQLHWFEILDWNGIDLRDLPQTSRRDALEMVYGSLQTERRPPAVGPVFLVEQRTEGIVSWFYEILDRGGEGIVAKRRTAKCRPSRGDGKIDDWVRLKRKNSRDMVVMRHGKAEGGTPNLVLGFYRRARLTEIQTCTLPLGWPTSGLEGEVVEVVGWELLSSGAVRSGHIKRLRTDKRAMDCVLE